MTVARIRELLANANATYVVTGSILAVGLATALYVLRRRS